MKVTTTTKEYDKEGRLVKETIFVQEPDDNSAPYNPVLPHNPYYPYSPFTPYNPHEWTRACTELQR